MSTLSLGAFENEPRGYGGLLWGTKAAEVPDLQFIRDEGNVRYYVRRGDTMTFGRAALGGVEYGFHDGELARVRLAVRDLLNFVYLREGAFRVYGQGKELIPHTERYYWDGFETRIELLSKFDFN